MKRTKLISILTCLTALTSSIVVVSCSNDKTTTLHNKQINISKLDLNTNLYDIKDNTPKTIIKTFLDINNHKLSNLNEDQLEVKMINDSSAIINIKNSNQFIGNTNIKFEAKENKINPTVITNTINWTNLTPALININSLNLITNLTNLNNSDNTTILDEFLKVNQTVLKDLSIENLKVEKNNSSKVVVKIENSNKYFGKVEVEFKLKQVENKEPVIKPSDSILTNSTISKKQPKEGKPKESELISAFKLEPAKVSESSKPSNTRTRHEIREEQPVNIKEKEINTNSQPLTPLTPAKHSTPLISLIPATTVSPLIPLKPAIIVEESIKTPVEKPVVASIIKEEETYENINADSYSDIDELYIKQTLKAFNEIKLSEQKAKSMMLRNDVSANFYSHPRFEINEKDIVLDKHKNNKVQLKLFDRQTQKEIDSKDVKWYQRTRYPEDKVFEENKNDNTTTFNLLSNGVLEWKDTKESELKIPDEKSAVIWASYKGYLYSTTVRVFSEYFSDSINNEQLAKQAAQKLVKENKWNDLPLLERLIKAYEWMTKNVKYDYDLTNGPILKNQNAHSALVLRYTVCTGYAKGFKLILDELGIPCRFIEGETSRETRATKHAWNLVQLDNEWYHVDTTSDRTGTHTGFNFFLNTNDDFLSSDRFNRKFDEKNNNQGKRFRNLKFKNFVSTEEDVLKLIDNNWNITKKQLSNLSLVINNKNFKIVNDAFSKRNLDVKNFRYGLSYGPNTTLIYTFNEQTNQSLTEVKVDKVEKYNDKHAIKVTLDQKVDDLKAGNFNITNALINRVEQQDKSYVLFLDHFNSYGNVDVKLESVKRKNYKFNITTNSTVKFNIQRQKTPNVELTILDDDSIKITNSSNSLNNLEYSLNNNAWQDLPANHIISKVTIGILNLRYKGSDSQLASDIQTIDLTRSQIPTNNNIKSINKALTGVNETMQYRLKNNDNWTNIDKNKVSGLSSGTYQIRIKPLKNALASEIIEVNID
ncbi:MAG6410 family transglutaminase-related lipoprotein [Mycoplasma mycoides]|uniref:MAG6410 family transglutaminase-related lipoprotein n=1 Tax=Mycoplasma mycoides TaxID=2102 RepID=UPI0022409AE4|nr:transglutaminase domain-containing protein [Mycoplasma mycoides]QVK09042.1 lipoprotein [Mycoplasma mycoides subsp. capri]